MWFHDQEVFDFISTHLHLITNHSFRTYLLALELKKAQMDWKRTILSRFLSGPLLLVAQLKSDPAIKLESERVKAFREGGGGGRSTYFKYAKKLHAMAAGCQTGERQARQAHDMQNQAISLARLVSEE